jgi:hypothetical protein
MGRKVEQRNKRRMDQRITPESEKMAQKDSGRPELPYHAGLDRARLLQSLPIQDESGH